VRAVMHPLSQGTVGGRLAKKQASPWPDKITVRPNYPRWRLPAPKMITISAWIHRLGWLVERVLTARMPLALRESGLSRT